MKTAPIKQNYSVHKRIIRYAQAEPDLIRHELGLSITGLSEEQAEKHRKSYGENQTAMRKNNTVLYCLRRAFVNPFSTILLLLAVISFLTDILLAPNFSRNVSTVSIIICMFLLSGLVRFIQEIRSKRIADRLTQLVHTTVQVCRNGQWQERLSSELSVGDKVRFQAGDRIPADIRLTEATDLFVSQSVITGESGILEKTATPLTKQPNRLDGYTNILFLGSSVTGGFGEGLVLAVGNDTVYGRLPSTVPERKNSFNRSANSIAWVLIKFMVILVPLVFVACGQTKGDWLLAFLFSLSVAVGLTPEMLPMVINACLTKGSINMGQKQTIVKNINAMQNFGSMNILCVDKTGTLTNDTVLLEYYIDILGNENKKVLDYAFLNSFYHTGTVNHLDSAILNVMEKSGTEAYFSQLSRSSYKLDELPFDYDRKFASILLKGEENNLLVVKGSIDDVVHHCRYVEYQGKQIETGTDSLSSVHAIVDEMHENGIKVLAVAYKHLKKETLSLEDEEDLTLLGYLGFFDAPKKSAASAIQKLRDLHVDLKVLTGDQKNVAISICRRLGMDAETVLTGIELDNLSDNDAPIQIEQTHIFAELTPKQKSRIIETLQDNGHTVGFLGDGMNDLPAIIQADVGISVDTAVEAVEESADVVLLKKDLNVLEEGILEGRKAFANMSKYIKITASSNLGNIFAIVVASVLLPFFPMTSVQLLFLNLLYDILCLVLPWDYVDQELYERPLEWSGQTLRRFMTFFGPISTVFDVLTFAFLFFYLCPSLCGGPFSALGNEDKAYFIAIFQTGWFLESMWTQILILHLLRTKKLPFLQSRSSPVMESITVLGILIFTALTITPLGKLLGLTAMPPVYFVFLVVTVILYLVFTTLAKTIYIRKYHDLI